ncbi:NADH-quinone oxidoreductase subunit C [Streptomyces sp. NPDC056361]|uniref:NADH-quinone oxidoreductase subunit C n=1 Tax=Streptomyces sp. NPDC056361 TaxID=3345795 RepID=UPI0035E289EA
MSAYDSLPGAVTDVFGEEATAEQAYDLLTVDVPPASWIAALTTARDALGCTYFDWLSAVDEPGTGFRVCAHVVSLAGGRPRRLLLRTTVPHSAPVLPTAIEVYAGAGWHERETHEMFGVDFAGHPHLVPLLLPENFEGHPLRKDFVLAARVAKAWPGAKEPGESHDGGGPKRRQMLPPGVPDPNEWGPLKGQLPPAPARPARAAAGDRPARAAAGDRPVRRARSVTEGSASQAPAAPTPEAVTPAPGGATGTPAPDAAPESPAARPPRRSRSAADGSASQAPRAEGAAPATPRTRSSDAPWHHARPAFDDEPAAPPTADGGTEAGPEAPAAPADRPEPQAEKPGSAAEPEPQADQPAPAAEPEPQAEEPAAAAGPEPQGDQPGPAGKPEPQDGAAEPDDGAAPASDEPAAPKGGKEPTDPAGGDPA